MTVSSWRPMVEKAPFTSLTTANGFWQRGNGDSDERMAMVTSPPPRFFCRNEISMSNKEEQVMNTTRLIVLAAMITTTLLVSLTTERPVQAQFAEKAGEE